jgi:hypothetical protein
VELILLLKGDGPLDLALLARWFRRLEVKVRRAERLVPQYGDRLIRARVRAGIRPPWFELLGLFHPSAHHACLAYGRAALAAGQGVLETGSRGGSRATKKCKVLGRQGRFGPVVFTDPYLAMFQAMNEAAHLQVRRRRRGSEVDKSPPEIISHGGGAYRVGNGRAYAVADDEDAVLTAFLQVPALDTGSLADRSGLDPARAVKALKGLRHKYGGAFAPAIEMPKAKGGGGYFVRIRCA